MAGAQMSALEKFQAGQIITVEFPFLRTAYEHRDFIDGRWVNETRLGWRPGQTFESDGYGDTYAWAHGMGHSVYKIIDIHKLPYPHKTRIFYIRTWIDPDGKPMGRKTVQILTPNALRDRIKKWQYPSYAVDIVEFTDADARKMALADRRAA